MTLTDALIADIREQVRVASFPDDTGVQVVTLAWLDRLLSGEIGTFQDSPLKYDGQPVPERLAAIEAAAAERATAPLVEALRWIAECASRLVPLMDFDQPMLLCDRGRTAP